MGASNSSGERLLVAFWRTVVRFDRSKLQLEIAARNAVATGLPLVAGALFGVPQIGVAASIGALNVCVSDRNDPYFSRARRLIAASLLVAFAVFAGGVSGASRTVAVLLVACSGFIAGLTVALGTSASDIATTSLVTLIVFSAQGLTLERSAGSALLALAGGLFETALALSFWPVQRHRPEQRALADAYREIAAMASVPANAAGSPPATNEMIRVQDQLSALHSVHTIHAERYLSLLNQAERVRLRLLVLARVRSRLARESDHHHVELLDGCLDLIATILREVAGAIEDTQDRPLTEEHLGSLNALVERFREPVAQPHLAPVVHDARVQLGSILGQLRSAMDLASHTTLTGEREFVERQARRHWKLRLGGVLATLRANLTLDSSSFRHAVRLAACLAAGELAAGILGRPRSYWLPMTIALVLKPDFTSTFTRGVLRLAGTFVGLVATTALFHFIVPGTQLEIAFAILAIFLLRYIGPANYGLLTANISAAIVLLIALAGTAPSQVIMPRAINTVAGGVLALIAYLLWPTWARERAGDSFANLLDAYRAYFHAVRNAYLNPGPSYAVELDRTRQAARVARTNVEAAVDRVLAEPGVMLGRAKILVSMLASSHRVVHAMMSLEAGLGERGVARPPAGFQAFTHDVEITLHSLGGALRGAPLAITDLPDLREAHYALLAADSTACAPDYHLVCREADHLTNSLNTLSEQVFRWIAPVGGANPY